MGLGLVSGHGDRQGKSWWSPLEIDSQRCGVPICFRFSICVFSHEGYKAVSNGRLLLSHFYLCHISFLSSSRSLRFQQQAVAFSP
jgi:hypothetical protein